MEGRRGRRGQTSPGEERGNETGKVAITHGSVEFCEATPIGLAAESQKSLYGRETDRDHLPCVTPRHVDAPRDLFFILSPNKQRAGGGEKARPDLFFYFFPVQQTTSGIGHRVK